MANLSIVFDMVDNVSSKLDKMSRMSLMLERSISLAGDSISKLAGHNTKLNLLEKSGRTLSDRFKDIEKNATRAYRVIEKISKIDMPNVGIDSLGSSNSRKTDQMLIAQLKMVESSKQITGALTNSNTEFDKITFNADAARGLADRYAKFNSGIIKTVGNAAKDAGLILASGGASAVAGAAGGAAGSAAGKATTVAGAASGGGGGLLGSLDITSLINPINVVANAVEMGIKAMSEFIIKAYEVANAFSNSSSVLVKATGATGKDLKDLNKVMMDVYSGSDEANMANIAAIVGEVNTRYGVTGKSLKELTDLFVLFADNTGVNGVASVKAVNSVMDKWNMDMDQTGDLLDKLTFTSQQSGASIDTLTYGLTTNIDVFKGLGFTIDDALALLSNLETKSMDSTTVFTGLRDAVSNLNAKGMDVPSTFREVSNEIRGLSDNADATTIAMGLFGDYAGGRMVEFVRTGGLAINDLSDKISGSKGTLAETADAADTLSDQWTKAFTSINTAFSVILSPALIKISTFFAKVVQGIGDLLTNTQKGLILLAQIIAAALEPIAKLFTIKFIQVWDNFKNKLSEIQTVFRFFADGIAKIFSTLANGITNSLTKLAGNFEPQIKKINSILSPFKSLLNQVGESVNITLSSNQSGPQPDIAQSQQNLQDYRNDTLQIVNERDDIAYRFQNGQTVNKNTAIDNNELIKQMEILSSTDINSKTEEALATAAIEKFKDMNPEVEINYSNTSNPLKNTATILKGINYEQYKLKEIDNLNNTQSELASHTGRLMERQDSLANMMLEEETKLANTKQFDLWGNERKEYTDQKAIVDSYQQEQASIENQITQNDFISASISTQIDAAGHDVTAIQSVRSEIDSLTDAYNKSYEAARNSIDGAIGLFETMEIKGAETSIEAISQAFDSQKAYIENYSANLEAAKTYGLDENLIASLSDGSNQSAEYLQTIIAELEKDGANKEALIERINTSFMGSETSKDEFGATVAEIENNYDAEMEKLTDILNTTVENMNLQEEAGQAAAATMSTYAEEILAGLEPAMDAAQKVKSKVASIFNSGSFVTLYWGGSNTSIGKKPGYANGTLNSENTFIAGEEGPELIIGRPGSTVFPVSETNKILGAMDTPLRVDVPESMSATARNYTKQEKKITLEIAGSGEINMGGSVNKESILEVMVNNIKPVLMNVLQQEIFEEGEACYEF